MNATDLAIFGLPGSAFVGWIKAGANSYYRLCSATAAIELQQAFRQEIGVEDHRVRWEPTIRSRLTPELPSGALKEFPSHMVLHSSVAPESIGDHQ